MKLVFGVTSLGMVLVLAVPTFASAQDARPIALDEAVRQARRNVPAAVQARNSVRQTAATVRTNYASFLPSLTFSSAPIDRKA